MLYLISQMLFSLLLAGLLGSAVTWWYQQARVATRVAELRQVIQKQQRMVAQADNDVRMVNEDYDELKRQSVNEIKRLREENQQIAILELNLEKSQLLVRQLLQKQGQQITPPPATLIPPTPLRQVAAAEVVAAAAASEAEPNPAKLFNTGEEPAPNAAENAEASTRPARRRRTGGLESRVAKGRHRKPARNAETTTPDELAKPPARQGSSRQPEPMLLDALMDEAATTVAPKITPKITPKAASRPTLKATPSATPPASIQAETKEHPAFVPPIPAPRTLPTTALPVSGHADSLACAKNSRETPSDPRPVEVAIDVDDASSPFASADQPTVKNDLEAGSPPPRRGWASAPVPDIDSAADVSDTPSPDTPSPDTHSLDTRSLDTHPSDARRSDAGAQVMTPSEAGPVTNAPSDPDLIYDPVEPYDDLQQIVGIGPLTEQGLNRLGITTYSQLAHLDSQDIEKIAEALEIGPGRIVAYDWVGSARQQLEDVLEEL